MGRGLSKLQRTILEMAYKNRLAEWEPRHRVLAFNSSEDKDLRALVPEAFERFRDGYWEKRGRYYLVAGSFEDEEVAKRFEKELEERGLDAYYHFTGQRVDTEEICDLFNNEVYCEVYGMQDGSSSLGGTPPEPFPPGFPNAHIVREWRNTHTHNGPNSKNGRHASARAAVSRAFGRLASRGLVRHGFNGIWLTQSGLQIAKELSVNKVDNITFVNH